MQKKVNRLISELSERKLTIAFAESMTCGLVAHQFSTVTGTSEVLMGSVVCYNEKVKTDLFRISASLINKHSAESMIVTRELAKKLRRIIRADVHAAVTGLASAGGSETPGKPPGTVFISVHFRKKYYSIRKKFNGSPLTIRKKTCELMYDFIYKLIKK